MAGQNDKPIKVVLVGDGGVGKTIWLHKVLGYDVSINNRKPTMGVDVMSKTINGTELSIWDCAGVDENGGLRDAYFLEADLCIAFSRDNMPGSARNVQDKWIPMVEKVAPNVRIVLAHPDDTGILHRMYE